MKLQNVIAIDGVAYSGKSTVAAALARLTGYRYVNTGHMYRAVAKLVLDTGVDLSDAAAVLRMARAINIMFINKKGQLQTLVNGQDWSHSLDRYELVQGASQVAAYPEVRSLLTLRQRQFLGRTTVIMEGRDIGTSVFPKARWKFFMTASLAVRAKRMIQLMSSKEIRNKPALSVLMKRVHAIDERDRSRSVSPLRVARDAVLYDNSEIPSPEQDALILNYYLRQSGEILKNSKVLKTKIEYL